MSRNRFRFEPPEERFPESYYYMPPRRRQLELDDIIETRKWYQNLEKEIKEGSKKPPGLNVNFNPVFWKVALFCTWPFVVVGYSAIIIYAVKALAVSAGVK